MGGWKTSDGEGDREAAVSRAGKEKSGLGENRR